MQANQEETFLFIKKCYNESSTSQWRRIMDKPNQGQRPQQQQQRPNPQQQQQKGQQPMKGGNPWQKNQNPQGKNEDTSNR